MSFWNSSEILQQKSLFIVLLHFSKPFFGNPRIYSVQKFWIKTCAINISELRKWNALFKCELPATLARKKTAVPKHMKVNHFALRILHHPKDEFKIISHTRAERCFLLWEASISPLSDLFCRRACPDCSRGLARVNLYLNLNAKTESDLQRRE